MRRELTKLLKAPVPDPSPARRRLRELAELARPGYMQRWADAAALPQGLRPSPERLARTVAAHLLDLGYEAEYLQRWARNLSRSAATAIDVLDSAVSLDRGTRREFTVLAVLLQTPEQQFAETQARWVPAQDVIGWLVERGHSTAGLRLGGGLTFRVTAWDPYGAAAQVRQSLERLVARFSFLRGARDGLKPAEHLWVDGHAEPIPMALPARGADILSLKNDGQLYRVDESRSLIDDALELAAPINRGAIGPAVAGAWAAVESLLSHPDDPREEDGAGKAVAADRLAAIIACSWPRAELTALAYRHHPDPPDALAAQIAECTSNRDRAHAVAVALTAGNTIIMKGGKRVGSDLAAVERMRQVLASPATALAQATRTFTLALRRLYRTRNIALHGGSTQGVAMQAALRTAAPLFGAGLDRMAHGLFIEGVEPLDLAARAEVALKLVEGETGLSVADLLEPRRR